MNISAAVLITGSAKAEVYHPSSGVSCTLPTMLIDGGRWEHTLEDSGLLCGGWRSIMPGNMQDTSCVQWSSVNGTWEEYLTLEVGRYYHVSWTPDPDIGTYLMGGNPSEAGNTTTLIKPDRSQEAGFILKYYTVYVSMLWANYYVCNCNCNHYRGACVINDPDTQTVAITGGVYTMTTVSVYGLQGWMEDLQPLNTGRYWHACSHYMSGGTRVR